MVLVWLFLIPLIPEYSVLGFFSTCFFFRKKSRTYVRDLKWFLVSAIFGLIAFVFQFMTPQVHLHESAVARGLLGPLDLAYLTTWNRNSSPNQWAHLESNGYWRLYHHSREGFLNEEIFVAKYYKLNPGQKYIQRFQLRTDAPIDFMVSIFTRRGHQPVRPKLEGQINDVYSFSVTFTANADDQYLRAFDLVGLGGSWTWLELGQASLSIQNQFQSENTNKVETWISKIVALQPWFGVGYLILAVFLMVVAKHIQLLQDSPLFAIMMLAGLFAQLLMSFFGIQNPAIGYAPEKNQIAHGAIMVSALLTATAPGFVSALGVVFAGAIALVLGARGALLVLVVVVVFALMQHQFLSSRRNLRMAGVILICVVAALIWTVRPSPEALQSGFARVDIWRIAIESAWERPQGHGPGQFANTYVQKRSSDAFDALVSHPHNLILGLLFEFGWLGLIGFLLLWIALIGSCIKARAWPVLMVVGSAFLLNIFDYTWFTAGVTVPLWLAIGTFISD
jgi:O-Antigen ligase